MKVMKFGGTSLADAQRYQQVFDICQTELQGSRLGVVLSAPKGVTNALSLLCEQALESVDHQELFAKLSMTLLGIVDELAHDIPNFDAAPLKEFVEERLTHLARRLDGIKLLQYCPSQVQADLLSLGEYVSVHLFSQLAQAKGVENLVIDPLDYIVAEGAPLDCLANLDLTVARFKQLDCTQPLLIMPGFVAADVAGNKVTLGRNGSDYSAAILAAGLAAECCEIWTDVDGVYNTDPNLVSNAVLLDRLTYQEAMELSYFGAKVLHPKTIGPIAQFNIPCLIRNTLNPAAPGTLISTAKSEMKLTAKGISCLQGVALFNIAGPGMKGMVGMAKRLFADISAADISVILITQSSSEYSISFCVNEQDATRLTQVLNNSFELELSNKVLDPIEVQRGLSIITLVGDNMRHQKGMAAKFFQSLGLARVNNIAIAQGSSERSISSVIETEGSKRAVRALHHNFFTKTNDIDLFIVGCGVVGGELLRQIAQQQGPLLERKIRIRVQGIANSKQQLLVANGIDLNQDWQAQLAEQTDGFGFDAIKHFAQQHSLVNPVIVDCTSAESMAMSYTQFIDAGFHVVTPNKKAGTANMDYYLELKLLCQRRSRQFLYETTVGAGLPVIDNLQKLLCAGDQIITFNGILSGSLSYICGLMDAGSSLSEATKQAKEKGYTEPDPRDDLSGMDVARKLLIIARETGLSLELEDIAVEPLLPQGFDSSGSIDEFMQRLPEADSVISALVQEASAEQSVLRYIGVIADGKCCCRLEKVAQADPLAQVKDGENALAIHTQYYQPVPYVIRGYGAGATVTAAGVFADILRTVAIQQEFDQ